MRRPEGVHRYHSGRGQGSKGVIQEVLEQVIRDQPVTNTGHVQGVTALLTSSSSVPRRGIEAVRIDHGCITHWRRKGTSEVIPSTSAKLSLRDTSAVKSQPFVSRQASLCLSCGDGEGSACVGSALSVFMTVCAQCPYPHLP